MSGWSTRARGSSCASPMSGAARRPPPRPPRHPLPQQAAGAVTDPERASCCCGATASSPTCGAGRSSPAHREPRRRPRGQPPARPRRRPGGAGLPYACWCGFRPQRGSSTSGSTSSWPTAPPTGRPHRRHRGVRAALAHAPTRPRPHRRRRGHRRPVADRPSYWFAFARWPSPPPPAGTRPPSVLLEEREAGRQAGGEARSPAGSQACRSARRLSFEKTLDDGLLHPDAGLREAASPTSSWSQRTRVATTPDPAGTGGAARAVQVGLVVLRAGRSGRRCRCRPRGCRGGDVGGDQHRELCRRRSRTGPPRFLGRSPWMAAAFTPSLELLGEAVAAPLGAHEHQRGCRRGAMDAATFTLGPSGARRRSGAPSGRR